eukprot:jgi/Mesen1/10079/ME000074S09419
MHEENKGRGGDGATTHDDATTNEEREAETQALVGEQGQARRCKVEEGIMSLLRRCLLAENQGCSRAALSGYVEHYASQRKEDMGWGCGWRNIQMLSSNLLHCDEEMRGALFGGAGFVPDIRGLQQWLEFAWRGGFDEVGAGQLDWKVVGTHKWIGTTECAALLRSFGLRAYIVDFKSSGRGHVAPAEHKKGGQEVGRRGHSRKPGRRRQGRDANGGHTLDKWRKEREQGERRGRQQGNSAGGSGACKKGQGARDERGKVGRSSPRGGRQNKRGGSTDPLYFQQQGHSRTIVGIERRRPQAGQPEEVFLLVLDPPLYFQQQGHSRTIVGIERRRPQAGQPEEVFLLVLDPSQALHSSSLLSPSCPPPFLPPPSFAFARRDRGLGLLPYLTSCLI